MSALPTTLYISREYHTIMKKMQFLTLSVKAEKPATKPKSTHTVKIVEICALKYKSDSKYAICGHTFLFLAIVM